MEKFFTVIETSEKDMNTYIKDIWGKEVAIPFQNTSSPASVG